MTARLLLKHEGITLNRYPLDREETTIGRIGDNHIQLDDAAVSSRHARIVRTPNPYLDGHYDYRLEDLDSTNGTKLNGNRITQAVLKHDDVIQIGAHRFIFDSGQIVDHGTTAIYLPEEDD